MKKLLIVVDMQNDFITGTLGSPQAQAIVPKVVQKITENIKTGSRIILTMDTHPENYLDTMEGKKLPVVHCIKGTAGWQIAEDVEEAVHRDGYNGYELFEKPAFGSLELAKQAAGGGFDEIELCGLCTDICVVSNALILKAQLAETEVVVDASCCAGVTPESHAAALLTMKMCQVNVTGEFDIPII